MDFLLNGQGHGDVASVLMANGGDPNALRPWVGADGRSYIARPTGRLTANGAPEYKAFVTNAPATLRKDQWIQLDTAVVRAAQSRLSAVADLRSRGLVTNIPDGLGTISLEYEKQSDITAATISMDPVRQGLNDRPEYTLHSLPLPVIHKDFQFTLRQVLASRNRPGTAVDTTTAELAGRKVAEEAERLLLGESSTYAYGGGTVYGYKNFPQRLTKALTAPTAANHPTTVSEVIAMRELSVANQFYGPWVLYYSPAWYGFMDEDYSTTLNQAWTLRQRLQAIEGIQAIKPCDFLSGTTLLLVQMTSDVVREVIGMDITTVQWESHGGMMLNFKVMAIMVPQLRSEYSGKTGIVHGSV
jgi:hypothetical protein